ncbi:hypothetical protein TL16_g10747 [Triparma laevis f. inornata]|uniref:IQCH-like ATP-grasp domain-containing protein n=1 Tax=Triparma laevis f. inornata TaxID=1714386 RepID=A0A9W7BEJ5_9STRA|nr:hypothetical protein TL16_g10747 [Triparma laevis f. inornata]
MVFAPAPPASSSPRSNRPKPPTSSFDASLLYATEEVPTLPPVMAVPLPKTSLVGAGATGGSRRGSSTRESLRRRKKGATKASEARINFLNKKINKGMHGSGAAALTMNEQEYAIHMRQTHSAFSTKFEPSKTRLTGANNSTFTSNSSYNPASVRYDTKALEVGGSSGFLNTVYGNRTREKERQQQMNTVELSSQVTIDESMQQTLASKSTTSRLPKDEGAGNPLQKEIEQIRNYLDMLDQYSLHNFIIWKGSTVTNTPEFSSFKRKYDTFWGSVLSCINLLETLARDYQIQLVVVDGAKCAELAACDAPGITEEDLLECISNKDQVLPIVNSQSSDTIKFGTRGTKQFYRNCAVRIQSWVRMVLKVSWYENEIRRRRAACKIQTSWRRCSAEWRVRKMLVVRRAEQKKTWERLGADFVKDWSRVFDEAVDEDSQPHVIVHVPSLSLEEYLRLGIPRFPVAQNLQLHRLTDVKRANVEVIYVAPFPMDDEILDYMKKILEIGGVEAPHSRFSVVVPENVDVFPSHFPLTSVLQYSPHALHRIRQMLRGKKGYLMPGYQGWQEKRVALSLNIPVLAPKLEVFQRFATRSGAKRCFMAADVSVPVGAHDIYDEEDFVVALCKLISSNLDVKRWMFKIDVDYNNVGSAYFDVKHLGCYNALLKERETLFNIHKGDTTFLPVKAQCLGREMFSSFRQFLQHFMRVGGVIEADPIGVIGRPSVNMLITPNGDVKIESCVDILVDDESKTMGSVYPMKSVPRKALGGAANAVAEQLKQHGFVGHFSVNFIAYNSHGTGLRMLGASIEPYFSNSAGLHNLMRFLCAENDKKKALSRSYAGIDALYNPSLSSVQYGSFFKLCRMQAVSFDLETLSGLMFLLFDSLAAGSLGCIAMGDHVAESMEKLAAGFQFIKANVDNPAAYNEVNLNDLDGFDADQEGGGLISFVRQLKSIEAEAAVKMAIYKEQKMKSLMKAAKVVI